MFRTATRRRLGQWVLLTLVCISSGAGADERRDRVAPLSQLFEQAIFAEESLGDLDRAIGIYQEILARSEAEREFVAQARLRLGICYLKKGDRDAAVDALQRLVTDFPGQKNLVAQARARLSELGVVLPVEGLQLRKVWDNPGGATGSPSADGRYLTFTDWSTGDLAIHDFQTGRNRRLTSKGSWVEDPAFAEFSVLSPDEKKVAYAWFEGGYDLRVIDRDGSDARVVLSAPDIFWLWPIGWSPDGERIMTYVVRESGQQLEWVSLDGEGSEPIDGPPEFPDTMFDLSPDGRWVAYELDQDEIVTRRDVFVLDASTGKQARLVEHPADERVLGWAPDGRSLIFLSDRTGQWSVWSAPVKNGEAAGPPELLKTDMAGMWPRGKLYPIGFTSHGSFFYSVQNEVADVFVADLGAEEDVTPRKLTQRYEGLNTAPEWSSDGGRVAWLSKRPEGFVIVIRDLENGEEREVRVSERLYQISGGIRWSPDGESFLVCGTARPMESWQGIFSIDAHTGEVTQIAAADAKGVLRNALWSPEDEIIYFERRSNQGAAIVAIDLETGDERKILEGYFGRVAISADGRRLAVTTDRFVGHEEPTIRVLTLASGEVTEVYRGTPSEPFDPTTPLAWMPDGRHLLVGKGELSTGSPLGSAELELWKIPVEGGPPVRVGVSAAHLANVKVHPDGDRIAFEAGSRRPEIWVMENFLPGESGGR